MSNTSDNLVSLEDLNTEQKNFDVGVLIYLGIIMVFGSVGNAFVAYIYYFKLDRTAANLFVAVLSLCDLFGSLVCVPLDIIVIQNPYTFENDIGCRIIRFLVMDVVVISALVVFAISVDRFKKVVLPLRKQMTRRQVGYVCIIIAVVSTVLSLPCFYVYSVQEVNTHRLNMTGMQCTLSKKVKGQMIYIIFLILICFLVLVALCTIYCLVGIKLCRYKKERQSIMNPFGKNVSKAEHSAVTDSCDYIKEQKQLDKIKKAKAAKKGDESDDMRPRLQSNTVKNKPQASFMNMTRTTLIMFLVSLAWVISYLPHLVAMVLLAIMPHLKHNLTHTGHAILGIGLRSFYFNNAANPWIYGIFNFRFRREVFSLLRKVTCR